MQVDSTEQFAFLPVRYPKEDGQFKAAQQQARSKWFQEHLNMSRTEAENLAFLEMEQLCVMEPGRMSNTDPLQSLTTISIRSQNSNAAQAAYWDYFNKLDERLIVKIPMRTFQRRRYYLGQNLDIYPNGKLPNHRNFFATIARKLNNIGIQMANVGNYSVADERKIHLQEKEMVRPAARFGFQPIGSDAADKYNVRRQRKHASRCRQAYKDDVMDASDMTDDAKSAISDATERTYTTQESTMIDWSESSSVISDNKPRLPQSNKILQRVEEVLEAETTVESVKKLSLKETIQQRVAAKKASKTQTVMEVEPEKEAPKLSFRQRLLQRAPTVEWEFDLPDSPTQSVASEPTVVNESSSDPTSSLTGSSIYADTFPTIIRSRPKASTIGAYFETMGSLIPPLYASSIFPRAANTEKLHWEVATGMPESELEKYDGQLQPQYIEDIKHHMEPILKAMDYVVSDQWEFDRYNSMSSGHMK